MSNRRVTRIAVMVWVVAITTGLAGAVLLALTWSTPPSDTTGSGPTDAASSISLLSFSSVGLLIASRRPGNLLGWVFLGVGLANGIAVCFARYPIYALLYQDGDLPGGDLIIALTQAIYIPNLVLITFLMLLFPQGRLPSSRWRPLVWTSIGAAITATLLLTTAAKTLESPFEGAANPLSIATADRLLPAAYVAILVVFAIMLSAAISTIVVRFGRSRGEERQQFKWFAFAIAIVPALLVAHIAAEVLAPDAIDAVEFFISLAIAGIQIAVGIAVLKYRLYEIDRLVSRTLVYGLLTVGLGAMYFGLVVGLQEALQTVSGGSNLAIALTTLLVAAMFLPARSRIQATVDRRFNRRSYDAARTVDAFALRLREQIDLDTLRYELLAVVDETMQPANASIWLRTPESTR